MTESANPPSGQTAQMLDRDVTIHVSMKYLLYLPKDYHRDSGRHWPLMLVLHGIGERGDDLQLVKTHGVPKILDDRDDFQIIGKVIGVYRQM